MNKTIVIILLFTLSSTIGYAQQPISMKSTAQGFSGQLHLGYGQWSSDDLEVDRESGINFGLKAAYGFTELIEAFARFDYAVLTPAYEGFSPFPYSHLDLGLRLNLGSTVKPWRPFVHLSGAIIYSLQEATDVDGYLVELDMTGFGLSLGGGMKYHITMDLAALIGTDITFGNMNLIYVNDYEYDDEFDANSFRLYVGMAYYF